MKHICTQMLCGLALGAFCTFGAAADAEKGVIVISTDGNQVEASFAAIDRIEIGNSGLTLERRNGENTSMSFSDIDKILIGSELSGLRQIDSNDQFAVWPTVTDGELNISGLPAGETVTLLDVNGATVVPTSVAEGLNTLSIASLPAGIYIVSSNNKSVKIIKN